MFHRFFCRIVPVCIFGLLAVFLLSSCALKEAADNREKMRKVRVGMTKEEVRTLMGEPLSGEVFNTPEVWYYYTKVRWFDGMVTRDECTPFVFDEFDKLLGFGNEYYKDKFKTEYWPQKAIDESVKFPFD